MRYDFTPLERLIVAAVGPRLTNDNQRQSASRIVADELGTTLHQVYRWRRYGVDRDQADEFAVKIGLHPAEVWPEWVDDATRVCEAEGCGRSFVPAAHARPDQRWCSTLCRKREWARQQYRRNPEHAQAERARANAYYAQWVAPFRTNRERIHMQSCLHLGDEVCLNGATENEVLPASVAADRGAWPTPPGGHDMAEVTH